MGPFDAGEKNRGTTSRQIADVAIDRLERWSGKEPLALWIHFMDPHAVHESPVRFPVERVQDAYDNELSWVDLTAGGLETELAKFAAGRLPIKAWLSIPIGVVTLAEQFPEGETATEAWFRAMVDRVKRDLAAFRHADPLRPIFDEDRAHLIGTSGAITSLAGMHLGLPRYDRSRVDGIWMTRDECEGAANLLLNLTAQQRADQPCIGPDRSDLVLAGAAILQAVQELWPCTRVRVADRGLREGILMSLMSESGGGRRRKRRRGRRGKPLAQAAE